MNQLLVSTPESSLSVARKLIQPFLDERPLLPPIVVVYYQHVATNSDTLPAVRWLCPHELPPPMQAETILIEQQTNGLIFIHCNATSSTIS